MKSCSKCNLSKPEEHFHKDLTKKDGLRPDCKECVRAKCLEYSHSDQGKVKRAEYNKIWSVANASKKNASCRQRQALKLQAVTSWSNLVKIEGLYKQAKELEVSTGIRYEVDHIVPLRSKIVCGLHVENNLRIVPATENRIKGNRFWPDCP